MYPTKEKTSSIVSHKEKQNSSVVSHNGGKPLPLYPTKKPLMLYPTTEENLFHCGIQRKKTCGIVGFNSADFSALHPTILLCCIYYKEKVILRCGIQYRKSFREVRYSTLHKILLWYRIQQKKNSCIVGYNGKKFVSHPEIVLRCIPQRKKPLPLCPTTEENLIRCIPQQKKTLPLYPQRKKTSSVVS
jgi:hypothetical protein